MPIRIKWDKYETALLIDTFWKIEHNPSQKKELIKELSKRLRKKAINSGIEIDEVFRNENGIAMQLSPISHAFFPDRPTLSSSALFEEMVLLYKENRLEFDQILEEANRMVMDDLNIIQTQSNKISFAEWLSENNNISADKIVEVIDDCSEYCLRNGYIKKSFWDICDKKELSNVCAKILSKKDFRVANKKNLAVFTNQGIVLYKAFLDDYRNKCSNSSNGNDDESLDSKTENHSLFDNVQDIKTRFSQWLVSFKGLSEVTGKGYVSAIKTTEEFAVNNISEKCILFTSSKEDIRNTSKELFLSKEFREFNEHQHNRFIIALRQYLEYMEIEVEQDSSNSSISVVVDCNVGRKPYAKKNIISVLEKHYPYGFNVTSPIELMRFKKYYESDIGKEISTTDEHLLEEINKCGFCYSGKLYVISPDIFKKIAQELQSYIESGLNIFYYEEIYSQNEEWLFDGKIVSSDMLKSILEEMFVSYQHRPNFFIARSKRTTEKDALISDIGNVWGESVLRSFTDLKNLLSYIPLDKIKYALANGNQFVWNSFETYTLKDKFSISEMQLNEIKDIARRRCDENGRVTFEELPLSEVFEENYELSESAIYEIISELMSDEFTRSNKALTRVGEQINVTSEIIKYCKARDKCTLKEAEQLMSEIAGELRYPTVIEAMNQAMVRIDLDNFVSDESVAFDIDAIDDTLDKIVIGNVLGMKEITSFAAFPYCGYQWNLFLIESYCRRFSKKFRYDCVTPNSKNAGAIIRKSFESDYPKAMAESIAASGIKLTEKSIFDYLIATGLMIKRQYNDMESLIKEVESIREGR